MIFLNFYKQTLTSPDNTHTAKGHMQNMKQIENMNTRRQLGNMLKHEEAVQTSEKDGENEWNEEAAKTIQNIEKIENAEHEKTLTISECSHLFITLLDFYWKQCNKRLE